MVWFCLLVCIMNVLFIWHHVLALWILMRIFFLEYSLYIVFFFLKSSPDDMFLLILEREGGRKREIETKINVTEKHRSFASSTHSDGELNLQPKNVPRLGIRPATSGMCLDWESNLQPFGVWDEAPTNWAARPGHKVFFSSKLLLHTCYRLSSDNCDLCSSVLNV